METVLIIEDEKALARLLQMELEYASYKADIASDGRTGLELALNGQYDYILLDLLLPGLNGIEVCRRIRAAQIATPIIMLTARSTVMDKVSGLDSGADDYLAKPVEIEELLARMRSLKRRLREPEKELHEIADLKLDMSAHMVYRGGRQVDLSAREFSLLQCLMKHSGRTLTREQLLNQVWGFDFTGETNVVDVYIRYLRTKIDEGHETKLIHTVRGIGYRLNAEQHSQSGGA